MPVFDIFDGLQYREKKYKLVSLGGITVASHTSWLNIRLLNYANCVTVYFFTWSPGLYKCKVSPSRNFGNIIRLPRAALQLRSAIIKLTAGWITVTIHFITGWMMPKIPLAWFAIRNQIPLHSV